MPIGDLIDMDKKCATPDCQHQRGAHGGTYYKRDCGVVSCLCKAFAEVRYTRNGSTWDGMVAEANRLDNEIQVWKIRQKQTEDANRDMRTRCSNLEQRAKNTANHIQEMELSMVNVRSENDALRMELAKCQEVLELMRQAGHLPPMLGEYLLGPDQSIEDEESDDPDICFQDC